MKMAHLQVVIPGIALAAVLLLGEQAAAQTDPGSVGGTNTDDNAAQLRSGKTNGMAEAKDKSNGEPTAEVPAQPAGTKAKPKPKRKANSHPSGGPTGAGSDPPNMPTTDTPPGKAAAPAEKAPAASPPGSGAHP